MEKIVIGIDPGSLGFLSCIMPNGNIEFKSINESSVDALNKTLCEWINKASVYEWGVIVVMEQVHAIFGSSAKATFSFGEIFGILKGLIMANNIPYHFRYVDTLEKAKEVPSAFNNWAVFYNGVFQTVNQIDEKAVEKMLKK